jgi:opacity protein-like surface antigen
MKHKKSLLTIIISAIALSWSSAAAAEDLQTLQDYLEQCLPEPKNNLKLECDRFKQLNTVSAAELEDESDRSGLSGYAGLTLGAFFPDIDESTGVFEGNNTELDDVAIGSSLFAGIRFNRYLGTDLELSGFTGDVDSDLDEDENYTFGAIFLNPRFTFPLGDKRNSLALFLSPGLGISQLTSTVEDEVDDFDRTTLIEDDTRFTLQIKGGVSVPVSSKFSILGQVRYASQTGDDAVDYLSTELGINFDF